MKKYIATILLLFTFGTYALYVRMYSLQRTTIDVADTNQPVTTSENNTRATTSNVTTSTQSKGQYKNGTYTGVTADAYYGNVQVSVSIKNGKIADVIFLDHPSDRGESIQINNRAMPILRSEAISIQSAKVNAVSGATDTSAAFKESLSSALAQAEVTQS